MTCIQIPLWLAKAFVNIHHRHNKAPIGHKFSIGLFDGLKFDGVLSGVAIAGRPTGRKLDDGKTLEVYRVCTDGTKNACSKLYSECVKQAKKRGYEKVITYTLQSETGASVRASNFKLDAAKAGGLSWNGRTKFSGVQEYKRRWIYLC